MRVVWCSVLTPRALLQVYASGSEDGTVRLWQTRVGTEYGLWRFNKPGDAAAADTNSK